MQRTDIFERLSSPYYIFAPDYLETSGGIRALHILCHALNSIGEEAYVTTDCVSNDLRTPVLTDDIKNRHLEQNLAPIVVYPEIVRDNPLNADNVVRYLLNVPGLISGESPEWQDSDLIFTHGWHISPKELDAHLLEIPLINSKIYNSHGVNDQERKGSLVFINRYIDRGGKLQPITSDSLEISRRVPFRTPIELAKLYRSAQLMYAYEPSTACFEALVCGCPIIYLPNDLLLPTRFEGYLGSDGSAWGADLSLIEAAKKNVHLAAEKYEEKKHIFWEQLENFVEITQDRSSKNRINRSALGELPPQDISIEKYRHWLESRNQVLTDAASHLHLEPIPEDALPSFQLFIRLNPGDETRLADTLDSLMQISGHWLLEIITTLPSPEGLDEIPCIRWHTVSANAESKAVIDQLAETQNADWLIELPAGAKLDQFYLWRCTKQIQYTPDALAFFVDDDCCNEKGVRFSPRFKPGVNPTSLQSSDLAGPICVRRDAWLATDGASHHPGSPWFSKLLGISGKFGWDSIKHIPDVLITYPDAFPSHTESCVLTLVQEFQDRGIECEIVPVSGRSWCIRHPLNQPPSISVAILTTGQLDLLSRCLTSVVEKTDYPNFEIIIALTNEYGAPDLDIWLKKLDELNKPKVRLVLTGATGNHAARCNAAAASSSSEFVLFLKEESVVIQGKWLYELVRSGTQTGISGVSPRLIQPGNAMIENTGSILGLRGIATSPYQGKVKLGEELGYLDYCHVARDVSTLTAACMLIRRESFLRAGGMDEIDLGNHLAEIDFCLKLRKNGERLVYQPLSTIVSSNPKEALFDLDPSHVSRLAMDEDHSKKILSKRWYPVAAVDPFWNPALSLAETIPTPELEFHARWQRIPTHLPRILANQLPNGQGDYRIVSPLRALSKAGMASECLWPQRIKGEARYNSISEIARLNPDSIVVQHYITTPALAALNEWDSSGCRPFTVYSLDDLITDMDEKNPMRKGVPANARARLQYALKRCDRLVVSTDFLAETYRTFVSDIKVVPNRLEQGQWINLRNLRRTSKKPRIGWAGGSSHHSDLVLLQTVIEQTRDQADWIFFGMCPPEIRPLLAEYHRIVRFSDYPAYLASLNLDLAVAPLAQTAFNRGKSNLRLLDYGILGIPVVCTDIDPYRNSPACRVNNTVAEWTEAIRARIHDPDAREREGDSMRRWVLDGYLLENHLAEWLEAHLPG
jgi:GT2 family glycosyltransferase